MGPPIEEALFDGDTVIRAGLTGSTPPNVRSPLKRRSAAPVQILSQTGVEVVESNLIPDAGPAPTGTGVNVQASTIEQLTMGQGFDRIVRTLFDVEATEEEYQQLRKNLTFQESVAGMGYGQLVDALDVAQDRALRSRELLALARVTLTNYEISCKQILASYREKATAELQTQKDSGKFSKAITNDDVEAVMARSYPKEWHAIATRIKESEEFVKVLGALEERWVDRAKNLQQMVARNRSAE